MTTDQKSEFLLKHVEPLLAESDSAKLKAAILNGKTDWIYEDAQWLWWANVFKVGLAQ